MNRTFRNALAATGSAFALIVGVNGIANACTFANTAPVTNGSAIDCITIYDGGVHSGNITNNSSITPTVPYSSSTPPGSASGISIVKSGTTLTGDIVNNGSITGKENEINIGAASSFLNGTLTVNAGATLIGSVTNHGTMQGAGTSGMIVSGAHSVVTGGFTNASDGSMSNMSIAFSVGAGASVGSLTNNGMINVTGAAIDVSEGTVVGSITNTGTLHTTGVGASPAIAISNGGSIGGSIINSGAITSDNTGSLGAAIQIFPNSHGSGATVGETISGSIVNQTGGTMTAVNGIVLFGTNSGFRDIVQGSIVNNGTITATGGTGITILSSTVVGSVTNTGMIHAAGIGIMIQNYTASAANAGPGSVAGGITNSGTITSTGSNGIELAAGVVANGIVNQAHGTISAANGVGILLTSGTSGSPSAGASSVSGGIVNQGTITAKTGIRVTGGSVVTGGITNSGNITGTTAAIDLTGEGAATTVNQQAGTITGNILLSGLGDTMNISGGAIAGNIVGDSAVNHANAGTINVNLGGGTFTTGGTIDVAAINVNSGTFNIANNVTAFGTFTNSATVGLANGNVLKVGSYVQNAGGKLSMTTGTSFAGTNVMIQSSGPVTLAGAFDLTVKFAGTTGETLTLLQSSGRTGTFSATDVTIAWAISYTGDDVLATFTGSFLNTPGLTPNEQAIANALNTVFSSGGLPQLKTAIGSLNGTQFATLLSQLSSEGYSDYGPVALENSIMFSNAVFAALSGIQPGNGQFAQSQRIQIADNEPWHIGAPGSAPWGVWLSGSGTEGSLDGNGNAHGIAYTAGGGAAGLDYRFNPNFTAGISAGAISTSFNLTGVPQKGSTNSYQFAVYGGWHSGPFYVDGLLGYAYDTETVQRTITLPSLSLATGNTDGNQFIAAAEIGYAYPIGPATYVTPFLDMTGGVAGLNGFTETGSSPATLHVNGQTTDSFRTVLGGQISTTVPVGWSTPIAVMARAGWAHEFADTSSTITANFAAAPGASFTVTGAPPIRDAAQLGLGLQMPLARNASLFARYDGEFSGSGHANAITGGLRFTW